MGSRPGSQRGQYDDARLGVSAGSLTGENSPTTDARSHTDRGGIGDARFGTVGELRRYGRSRATFWTERPNQWTKRDGHEETLVADRIRISSAAADGVGFAPISWN